MSMTQQTTFSTLQCWNENRTVRYYEDSISNSMSLKILKSNYHVTYDNATNDCFQVHNKDGTKHVFLP